MWPGIRSHFLFRVHGAALASPDFRDRHDIKAPADLLRVPRITPDDYWWDLWFEEVGIAAPEKTHGGIRLDAQSMEGNAAMAGAGVAILAPVFWRGALRNGAMFQLFPEISVEPRAYWLVYPD